MVTTEFVDRVFARRPDVGLSLILVFSRTVNVRQAMAVLRRLHEQGVLIIESQDELTVTAMAETGLYDRDENRNVRVLLLPFERDTRRLMRLAAFLETIRAGSDNNLQALQSSRQKRREAARDDISSTWISEELRDTVADWGMTLHSTIVSDANFRMLEISIQHDGHRVTNVRLDGWSGLMVHRDRWLTDLSASASRMNQLLLEDLTRYLESITV